jgi:H+-translocating NAD(P) transhydrogenase subunit alpha
MGSLPAAGHLTVGVVAERYPGERRVALDPATVRRLLDAGRVVLVESGAGEAASFPDQAYTAAGATLTSRWPSCGARTRS